MPGAGARSFAAELEAVAYEMLPAAASFYMA